MTPNMDDRTRMNRVLRDTLLDASEAELREALSGAEDDFDSLASRGRAAAQRALADAADTASVQDLHRGLSDYRWIKLHEVVSKADGLYMPMMVREDQILGFGVRVCDGDTWLQTAHAMHVVRETVDEILSEINKPEWAETEDQ